MALRRISFLCAIFIALAGARAFAADQASALVAELYRKHDEKTPFPFFQTEDRAAVDAYFANPLADLLWKDAVESHGEVGALDFDPLYDAQDVECKKFAVHPAEVDGGSAEVEVTFINGDEKRRLLFSLVEERGGWRISDLDYGNGRTLRGILGAAYSDSGGQK